MTEVMIHVDHPEDERFDEVHIYVVERWKESELSGDEWRFSYVADVKRKGETIITISASKLDWLLEGLSWRITTAGENDNFDRLAWKRTEGLCDQPGCKEPATIAYRRKARYTNRGDKLDDTNYKGNEFRIFCDDHRDRGDCDLDDAMHNYEVIGAPNDR